MKDLTDRALDTAAKLGATYADVRVIRRRDESISVKSGRVEGVALGETDGFGVRVVVDGAWGFAASDALDLAEADRVGALAVRVAKASATALRRCVDSNCSCSVLSRIAIVEALPLVIAVCTASK